MFCYFLGESICLIGVLCLFFLEVGLCEVGCCVFGVG